jgi:hypothetical protein
MLTAEHAKLRVIVASPAEGQCQGAFINNAFADYSLLLLIIGFIEGAERIGFALI